MKFKQQEGETPKNNSFLDSIIDLLELCLQFKYAIQSQLDLVKESCEYTTYDNRLNSNYRQLKKLAISLNPQHTVPVLNPELTPAKDVNDLVKFEEKYYNMLKEIGNNALEQNNAEVFSYLSLMIYDFKHYFCTLVHEDNSSGETSS
jgi:hypothetical protein